MWCQRMLYPSISVLVFKGTPWGLEYTFSSALFVTTRPIHILVFDTYMPRYICSCLQCSLIAFSASWSHSMCKFQQFPFEITRSQGVPLSRRAVALALLCVTSNERFQQTRDIPSWYSTDDVTKYSPLFRSFKLFDFGLSLIHIWRCRRYSLCRSRWSPYH